MKRESEKAVNAHSNQKLPPLNEELARRLRQRLPYLGHFSGLFPLDQLEMRSPVLVASADGVGDKLLIAELMQHAADELRHAEMVTTRVIQLGGTPLTNPAMWFDWTNCGYDPPEDPFVQKILEQNIKGEQCAISVYHKMIEEVGMKDPVTYNMAVQILQDEVEHEEDLQSLLEDLTIMLKK